MVILLRLTLLTCCLLFTLPALSAKPSGLGKPDVPPEVYKLQNPIEKAQRLLKKNGFYEGTIDGIEGADLLQAVKRYQLKHGLKATGVIDQALLDHLENIDRVSSLIKRLDEVREQRKAEAREALLSDPRTKKLLETKDERTADPTRDPSACFEAPNSSCLLHEAIESSRAVFEDDLRDWALGEILAAQVRAGHDEGALQTAARIKDSRLIIAALANIAKTHAHEGQIEEALSGLSLIPALQRQLTVMLEIAQVYEARNDNDKMREMLEQVWEKSQTLEPVADRITIQISALELLSHIDPAASLKRLDKMAEQIQAEIADGSRNSLMRQVASAMAETGHPEWALKIMDKLPDDETRIPILMASTRAFLKAGRFDAAKSTMRRISADRYRSVVMADMVEALWRGGRTDQAFEILDEAESLALAIKLPFARNFALSQQASALIQLVESTGDDFLVQRAVESLSHIKDDRLKARGLWNLARVVQMRDLKEPHPHFEEDVVNAMSEIKSRFSRAWILGDLVDEHVNEGELDLARKAMTLGLETAKNLTNPWARSRALAKFGALMNRLD